MISAEPSKWKVLLVEDDDSNRDVIDTILSFHGATVVICASGAEALNQLTSGVNLGLLDIQMPGMTGWDLLKLIRAHSDPVVNSLPIVAITAHSMIGDREKIIAGGFNGYISKPVIPETLVNDICSVLGAKNESSAD